MAIQILNLDFDKFNAQQCPQGNRIGFGLRPPMVDDWIAGDIIYNLEPAIGLPTGWICVVSGCPGTWNTLPERVA